MGRTRTRKTFDVYLLEQKLDSGWETIEADTAGSALHATLQDYRRNAPGVYRIRRRRAPIDPPPPTYMIVRAYDDVDRPRRVIARRLSETQARAHCRDPETRSSTATGMAAADHTRRYGAWVDHYTHESRWYDDYLDLAPTTIRPGLAQPAESAQVSSGFSAVDCNQTGLQMPAHYNRAGE